MNGPCKGIRAGFTGTKFNMAMKKFNIRYSGKGPQDRVRSVKLRSRR